MLFSIIIPIYNAETNLNRTLESIASQDFYDYQVIMINDGSTDHSEDICKKYVERYSNFHYLKKKNSGVSETRNLGISYASGDYAIFVDADDMVLENALKDLARKIFDMNFPDLVIGNHETKIGNKLILGTTLKEQYVVHKDRKLEIDVINYNFAKNPEYGYLRTVWAKAFSLSMLKKEHILFQKDLKIGEDMVFLLECIIRCRNYSIINTYLYLYCINSNSVMQSITWAGIDENLMYLNAVENLTQKYKIKCDLTPIWFEISERDWLLLIQSDKKLSAKYYELKKIVSNKYYVEYSKKEHHSGRFGKLFELYSFSIRNRLVLLFLFLILIKNYKLKIGAK